MQKDIRHYLKDLLGGYDGFICIAKGGEYVFIVFETEYLTEPLVEEYNNTINEWAKHHMEYGVYNYYYINKNALDGLLDITKNNIGLS